ncbi:MAG: hypothetical protein CMJ89_13950 [Planctomycetes bacterium]|nr:hypothetical protein [Planctomycetota bacterium]
MAEKKDARVVCPCCNSRIEVDVRTGKILRWRRPEELDETGKPIMRDSDWNDASQRVSGRLGEAQGRFDSSFDKEKSRERDLDDLFRKAQDKLQKKKEERRE